MVSLYSAIFKICLYFFRFSSIFLFRIMRSAQLLPDNPLINSSILKRTPAITFPRFRSVHPFSWSTYIAPRRLLSMSSLSVPKIFSCKSLLCTGSAYESCTSFSINSIDSDVSLLSVNNVPSSFSITTLMLHDSILNFLVPGTA